MKLWLDDVRDPLQYGRIGWMWVTTAEDAIAVLKTGAVTQASLDHDLSAMASIGQPAIGEKTGYTVVLWMEENNVWPKDGVEVHSMNPAGAQRMLDVICRHCNGRRVTLCK